MNYDDDDDNDNDDDDDDNYDDDGDYSIVAKFCHVQVSIAKFSKDSQVWPILLNFS